MSYDYIRVDDVLAIHVDQIKRYGGTHGLRNPGLLEAALFRPWIVRDPATSVSASPEVATR